MTTQQRFGETNPVPPRSQPNADPGVIVEESKRDDGNRVTHTTLRATSTLADELDLAATVAFHDDRVETDDVKAVRRFANLIERADGPVVIVPIWWLDTAKTVAEKVHTREEHGVKWSNSTLQFIDSTISRARREGYRRVDFDYNLAEYTRKNDTALVESTNGKWHICSGGKSACSHFDPDGHEPQLQTVNLADVIGRFDLCRSANKRISNLLDRCAGTSTARRLYHSDD